MTEVGEALFGGEAIYKLRDRDLQLIDGSCRDRSQEPRQSPPL